jgi:CHAD domain-containing protein
VIYVVMEHSGSYEDHWQHPVYVTLDKPKAEARKALLEELFKERAVVHDRFIAAMKEWEVTHPRPNLSSWNDTPLPAQLQSRPKKTWTADEVAFAKSLKETNELGRRAAGRPYSEWATERYEQDTLLKSLMSKREKFAYDLDSDASWEIEELELDHELSFA